MKAQTEGHLKLADCMLMIEEYSGEYHRRSNLNLQSSTKSL